MRMLIIVHNNPDYITLAFNFLISEKSLSIHYQEEGAEPSALALQAALKLIPGAEEIGLRKYEISVNVGQAFYPREVVPEVYKAVQDWYSMYRLTAGQNPAEWETSLKDDRSEVKYDREGDVIGTIDLPLLPDYGVEFTKKGEKE